MTLHRCYCGCGGNRWAHSLNRVDDKGRELTRDHLHCIARQIDPEPTRDFLLHDDRGVPVYAIASYASQFPKAKEHANV